MAENSPQQFGKYVLLSKIAAGGMAVTYRARMTGAAGVTKPCVIKQILPHFVDDADFVEMFIGEARVVASMSHSNIAQIFDFGEVDGQYFIAMELVQGQPLSKVLRRAQRMGIGSLPESLALHVASKLCDGLDYAHRHVGEDGQALGLVHRDVSPDNVLISYEGEVKVIDFGIAKVTSAVEAKTSPGTLKGKYPYFSPEQAQGRQDLDARTDVYAAGVVLYEMVCGKRPYEGEFVTVLPRILVGDRLPPSALNPTVSEDVETVISHAMALDREARYQTAKDLSESLVELLYRDNPRFTPTLLSQLMAHLFPEELAAEGRRVEVSPAFQEQLAAWQSGVTEASSQGRARLPSNNAQRGSNPGVRSRPGSDGGRPGSDSGRPGSEGGRRPSASNPGVRRPTSSGVRRMTQSQLPRAEGGVRRTYTAERPGPPVPELDEEPGTDAGDVPTPTQATPHDTPIEVPAAESKEPTTEAHPVGTWTGKGYRTSVDDARDTLAREEAARVAKGKEKARVVTMSVIYATAALFLVGVFYKLVIARESAFDDAYASTTTLWLASKPAGASVRLNDQVLKGVTPMMVEVKIGEANTLALSLPGHLPWTKRFTPTSNLVEPLTAELKPVAEPPPPPPTPVEVAVAAPEDAGAAVVAEGGAAPEDGGPGAPEDAGASTEVAAAQDGPVGEDTPQRTMHEVDYPTRVLVLRPQYNAVPLPEYNTASIELNPGTTYSVWTQGNASLAEGRGTASGTLAYFIEGDGPVDSSFGLLGTSTRTIKGARKLHVFALDDSGPDDNSGAIRVNVRQSAYVPPRSFTFDAKENAVPLKPEHQMVLRGLNPDSTYLLTVRDDFAELRSGPNGRVRQVLCLERGPAPESVRATHRILQTGKRYQLTGTEDLHCTFPDMQVDDNRGAFEVDIVDVTAMSGKERAEALKGSRRSER
ncbi:serine/threonine protein kinase [Myxococcus xanthus]|uniref:Serine/threonine protein kinase n=1 Tax=Myxococcus xanthus TaxID=34 RepID=A0AAE6FUP3_MYXXA|nr:serine/threonine-protein kinase [Myxococcus xanthus]QDE65750.1 serine/threonine protein kinase [Myxococcus xanthus]QDE73023.1 serine/threonine protein kinase [Myxococcus xanthus]QDF01854.1 serine/threonine protein kinase [Myxococcus xanthus]